MRPFPAAIALLVAAIGACSGAAQDGTEPVPAASHFVPTFGFLALTPADAATLAPGVTRLDVTVSSTNTFVHSAAAGRAMDRHSQRAPLTLEELRFASRFESGDFAVDGELTRVAVRYARGLRPGLDVAVTVPIVSHGGGFLDGTVEAFHGATGLGQSGREQMPRGGFLVYFRNQEREIFLDEPTGTGVGDVALQATQVLPARAGIAFAVEATLEAPTGDWDSLRGSGSWDLGLQLLASRPFGRVTAHAGGSVLVLGRSHLYGTPSQALLAASITCDVALSRSTSLQAQLAVAQNPLNPLDIEEVGAASYHVSLALAHTLRDRRTRLTASVTENIVHYENSSDFGLALGVTRRF